VPPPLVLHLNGAPGVGKSTLARRWAEEHPGTLLLDPDALRTWVSGWREDFVATGAVIRPVAIAMLAAYATAGGDVVLPQLVADPAELTRFEDAATSAGGRFVEVFLEAAPADVGARFDGRTVDQPWLEAVRDLVGRESSHHLARYVERLAALAISRPDAIRLPTRSGEVDAAYRLLAAALAGLEGGGSSTD
jgi:predicted kinase